MAPAGCPRVLSTRRRTCPHKHAGDACTCTMLPDAALSCQVSSSLQPLPATAFGPWGLFYMIFFYPPPEIFNFQLYYD